MFWDAEPAAGKLLLPYLAWTAYATVLNGWIWNKNPRVRLIVGRFPHLDTHHCAVFSVVLWHLYDGYSSEPPTQFLEQELELKKGQHSFLQAICSWAHDI